MGKELVILLFKCVVGKCFVFYVFSFPPAVYVGTLNLIASIPGPSILTLQTFIIECFEHVLSDFKHFRDTKVSIRQIPWEIELC